MHANAKCYGNSCNILSFLEIQSCAILMDKTFQAQIISKQLTFFISIDMYTISHNEQKTPNYYVLDYMIHFLQTSLFNWELI